jgi:hypothetical protein
MPSSRTTHMQRKSTSGLFLTWKITVYDTKECKNIYVYIFFQGIDVYYHKKVATLALPVETGADTNV